MAKRRQPAAQAWDADSASSYMAEQFRAEAIAAKSGIEDSTVTAMSDVGLYLPSLSLRTLFQRTCYPLERSMIIFGPTGSNKSALLYWFYWLFTVVNKGKYLHVEVEDKDTPILRLSILEYRREVGWVRRCESMDAFMSTVNRYFDWFKGVCAKAGGPGRRVPFVVGIDSLVAKMTEEAAAKVEKEHGVPGRRFADEARALSDWFKIAPGYLQGWPFSLISINHDKTPKTEPGAGPVVHRTPGGTAPNYYATYKMRVERVRQIKQQATGWEGNRLRLTMDKCSMATSHRSVDVEFVWRMEETVTKTGRTIMAQRSVWNWHKATTEMLFNLVQRRDQEGARAAAVADILGIQRRSAGRYHAKGLDLGPDDAVSATEFGRILETRRDVLDQLEPRLGIHHSHQFVPGVDFQDQIAEAISQVDDHVPDMDVFTAAAVGKDDDADGAGKAEEAGDGKEA